MITEIFWKTGVGRRLREVVTPTAGAKKLNARLYSLLGMGAYVPITVTAAPVIAGTAAVASVLTCTPGTYAGNPAPTVSRQWYRNTTAQSGQTGLTYTVQAGDAGQAIKCREQATNAGGSITADSNVLNIAVADDPEAEPEAAAE